MKKKTNSCVAAEPEVESPWTLAPCCCLSLKEVDEFCGFSKSVVEEVRLLLLTLVAAESMDGLFFNLTVLASLPN